MPGTVSSKGDGQLPCSAYYDYGAETWTLRSSVYLGILNELELNHTISAHNP